MLTLCRLYLNRVCSTQDNENVSGWRDAYAIASNAAGDHPAFNVSYQSHFEPYAKWIWARWPPTEGLPPRRHGASALSALNCAFCRADQLAKPAKVASFRGKNENFRTNCFNFSPRGPCELLNKPMSAFIHHR